MTDRKQGTAPTRGAPHADPVTPVAPARATGWSDAPTRRRLMAGFGAAGGIAALAAMPAQRQLPPIAEPSRRTTARSIPSRSTAEHQAGVVTPQPAAALVAAFDVLADDRAGLERLLRTLTGRIAFLTSGGPAPVLDPRLPPAESGLLGPQIYPDNLTMTVAVGASLFDQRFGLPTESSRGTSSP